MKRPGGERLLVTGALLAAAVSLLLALKNPNMLLLPPLASEDASEMLAFYYCDRDAIRVFRFYNGYVSLVPNLIGYLSAGAPIALAPRLLAVAPFCLTVACYLLPFGLGLYRPAAGTRAHVAAPLFLAALPLASARLVANTTYSLGNCMLALSLLAVAPPARRWTSVSARFVASALLLWSHPLSIAVLPIYASSLVRDARLRHPRALASAALILIGIAYLLVGVKREELHVLPPLTLLQLGLRYLAERVVLAATLGNEARVALHASGLGWLATALGTLIAALVALLCWRRLRANREERPVLLGLGYLVIALTFASVLGRLPHQRWLWSLHGERYFYTQQALVWLILVLLAAPVAARLAPAARGLGLAAVCAYALAVSYAERGKYAVSATEGRNVASFVERVARIEERNGGRRGVDEVLVRSRGAPLRLRAPAENLPCEL